MDQYYNMKLQLEKNDPVVKGLNVLTVSACRSPETMQFRWMAEWIYTNPSIYTSWSMTVVGAKHSLMFNDGVVT